MTIDESIEVLTAHKEHWERLLSEGICDAHEGRETIEALTTAIKGLEAWEKVKAEIEQVANKQFEIAMGVADLNERYAHIQMENAYRHCLNTVDKHLEEVTHDD